MKRRSMLCMIAAAFLLCWGGVVSCSSDSSGDPPAPEVHDGVWKINYGDKAFVGTSEGATANKTHNDFPGYDGSYIDGLGGGYVDYAINATEEQDVQILLHYGYWGYKHALRGAQIVVNGVTDTDIIYCNWTNEKNTSNIWQDSNAITIRLKAGDNALRVVPVPAGTPMPGAIYPDGADETQKTGAAEGNLPNIDYLQITGKGLSAGNATATAYYRVKASGDFGTVTLEPEQDYYAKGTEVTLTANPKNGYEFDAWWGTRASNEKKWKIPVTEELNLTAHFIPEDYTAPTELFGYATITDDAGTKYTITGGANGTEITISSLTELENNKDKLSGDDPYIITVSGLITTKDERCPNVSRVFNLGSNKTLQSGTSQGQFQNVGVKVLGSNVIIKNLIFGEVIADSYYANQQDAKDAGITRGAADAMELNGVEHVWIDHCDFQSHLTPMKFDESGELVELTYSADITSIQPEEKDESPEIAWRKDYYDGLLDIKNGSTWITISNCYFHDHWKACLCSSGDGKADTNPRTGATDVDMRVTFYGNYWKDINARQPLFRWGKAHVFNSYFHSDNSEISGQSTGINCRAGSEVYIDNNVFENIKTPIGYYNDVNKSRTGYWVNKDNIFTSSGNVGTSSTSYKPPYTWTPAPASTVKTNVLQNAGAGKLDAADLQ